MDGLRRYGLSVAASRMTTGNHKLYLELEKQLSRFFRSDSAVVVPTGYATNLAVGQAFSGQFSHALIDEAAHPSLADAANLLDCPVIKFSHRSSSDVASKVTRCGPEAKIVLLTDGMFARDGSVAPLAEYRKLLPKDALMLVDDAHAAGLLGAHGRGTLEHTGVGFRGAILTVTLSKAFGTYGGAILGSTLVRKKILERSALFIGSTPLPLPLITAGLQSLALLSTATARALRRRLAANIDYARRALQTAGLDLPATEGPIIAFKTTGPMAMKKLKQALIDARIYPPFLKYPGGPPAGYFRFVVSSEHTKQQLETVVSTLCPLVKLMEPL